MVGTALFAVTMGKTTRPTYTGIIISKVIKRYLQLLLYEVAIKMLKYQIALISSNMTLPTTMGHGSRA